MNKTELIKAVAQKAQLTQQQAHDAVDAATEIITEALGKGEQVSVLGFGTWSVGERGERQGRNLRTGEAITIPAKKVIKFKAGSELAGAI